MIRPRQQRKHIEEVYGTKLDQTKFPVTPATNQNVAAKPGNATERAYGNITCGAAAPCKVMPAPTASAAAVSETVKHLNSGKDTNRRKSARPSNKIPNEKQCGRDTFALKEGRKSSDQAIKNDKHLYITQLNMHENNKTCGNANKEIDAEKSAPHQHQHRHHHHQHNHQSRHYNSHDEDKDDDTDEFFDLIRRTVEGAIGKSISELLNRNFKELSSKVERFSADLKNTNALLYQMQKELINKIGHYGEENSRHFRYLCMKSEYDKMFYQHQTMIATGKPPSADISTKVKTSEKRKCFAKTNKSAQKIPGQEGEKANSAAGATAAAGCCYHNTKCKQRISDPHNLVQPKSSSGDVTPKSSEVGIREVLQHIQNFCTHIQFNDTKYEQSSDGPGTSQQRNVKRHEDVIHINKKPFMGNDAADEEDDDEDEEDVWEISSDGMTPRNKPIDKKYGATTARADISQRENNGAGDA